MRRRKGLHFYNKRKKISSSTMKEIGNWIFIVGMAMFLAFFVVYSIGTVTSVIGVSMENSLYNGQKVMINRLSYMLFSPQKGDVIVFQPNGNKNSHYYIKRVIAVPGETVQIMDGKVYVDGELEADSDSYDKIADAGVAENEIQLGDDEFFVLGDNRNNSEDSRSTNIGNVQRDTIIGRAWFHMASQESSMGLVR
ncbi:MAG: signal peptidase I [Lachnospiraceae bacterium]|nr:signal peptidase I [Lachnospiraceae bacterium]